MTVEEYTQILYEHFLIISIKILKLVWHQYVSGSKGLHLIRYISL